MLAATVHGAKDYPLHIPVPSLEQIPVPLVKLNLVKGEPIIKHIPQEQIQEVPVQKHVQVNKPVEVIKHIPITKEVFVERPVEVIKEIPIEKVIIDKVEVPYEVIKHVEKIRHIPVEKHVEVIKQVEVIKHVPYKRYVFNKIPSTINYQIPEYVRVPYKINVLPEAPPKEESKKTDKKDKKHEKKGWGLASRLGW